MKVLQINSTVNTGSTGRIAEEIGRKLIDSGYESYIAHGRGGNSSQSKTLEIGGQLDTLLHGGFTLFTDRHGFASTRATKEFLKKVDQIKPDVIGLHNLHGYYINIELLFDYIRAKSIPVVWTLFDCWAFTGHCSYYDSVGCQKWKTQCHNCPKTDKYPKSFIDNSKRNFIDKKRIFNSLNNLELIVHSDWLKNQVEGSFLNKYPIHHIYNGVNVEVFKPVDNKGEKIVLGVASTWDERKGLNDFIKLRELLSNEYQIVLIGLSESQIQQLPKGIKGIKRTESVAELANWYSRALCFVNPTYQDNFPTTNIEALACGTPVITYDTGGSPEAVDVKTGVVVERGDIEQLANSIGLINTNMNRSNEMVKDCRERVEVMFDTQKQYAEYEKIFNSLVSK